MSCSCLKFPDNPGHLLCRSVVSCVMLTTRPCHLFFCLQCSLIELVILPRVVFVSSSLVVSLINCLFAPFSVGSSLVIFSVHDIYNTLRYIHISKASNLDKSEFVLLSMSLLHRIVSATHPRHNMLLLSIWSSGLCLGTIIVFSCC